MIALLNSTADSRNIVPNGWFKQGESVGNLSTTYTEYSGLTNPVRPENKDYLWAIEDGGTAYILAINAATAALSGKWALTGVTTSDVEDCTSYQKDGNYYIIACDTGDNANARSTFKLIRVKEPIITGSDGTIGSPDIETITCAYPAGNDADHSDCECAMADPDTGDIYLITKRAQVSGPSIKCYRLPYATSYSGTQTLEYMGGVTNDTTLNTLSTTYSGNNGYITGGSISPNGNEIILRSYTKLYHWRRNKSTETIYQCLARVYDSILMDAYVGGGGSSSITTAPKCLHPNQEPQGESVTFDFSGSNIYTCSEYLTNEGSSASAYPLFKYPRYTTSATKVTFQQGVSSYSGCVDTYLDSSNPTLNSGSDVSMVADIDFSTYPTHSRDRQCLLKFDTSSIPTTAKVVSAYLDLYINTEGKQFHVYQMLTSWSGSSTWSSMSGGVSTDGVDAASTPIGTYGVTTASQGIDGYTGFIRVMIPLTLAQLWVATPASNHGLLILSGVTDTTGDGLQFDTAESATSSRRPSLSIVYT